MNALLRWCTIRASTMVIYGGLAAAINIVAADHLLGQAEDLARSAEDELGTTRELEQFETKLKDLVRQVAPAVVKLRYGEKPGGSGVVFEPSGLVLTHGHHTHRYGETADVHFPDGKTVPGKLIGVWRGFGGDLSLVRISRPGSYPFAPLCELAPPRRNDWCFHLGYPGLLKPGDEPTTPLLRLGRVCGVGSTKIYASCLTSNGDSGGPLFDLQGQVIGIARGGFSATTDVPSDWTSVPSVPKLLLTPFETHELEREEFGFGRNNRAHLVDRNRGIPTRGFEQISQAARRTTVEVWVDNRRAAIGVVVRSDGVILTKRADVVSRAGLPVGKLTCRMSDGTRHDANVIGESHTFDVALLRIDQQGLEVIPWSNADMPERGSLSASVAGNGVLVLGVIGTDRVFEIPAATGYVPLKVEDASGGVRILDDDEQLKKVLGRDHAVVRTGDVITEVEGRPVPDRDTYAKIMKEQRWIQGDMVQVTLMRDGRPRSAAFHVNPGYTLGSSWLTINDHEGNVQSNDPAQREMEMPYKISPRRSGFPVVMGHDGVLANEDCGGPLIDTQGRVVAINIARCRAHQTLAIPCATAKKLVAELLMRENKDPSR